MKRKIQTLFAIIPAICLITTLFFGCSPVTHTDPEHSSQTQTESAETLPVTTTQAPETTTAAPPETTAPPTEQNDSEAVTDEYFSDALFIGDSRVEGLQLYGNIKSATYYTAKGLTVTELQTKSFIKTPNGKKTLKEMLGAHKFGKIYIKLGVNELGWPYPAKFAEAYGKLLDQIIELQTDALIYVQSILPVTAKKSADGNVYTNKKINTFNEKIVDLCTERDLIYLNVRDAVMNEDGMLPEDASGDGVHLNKKYCALWCDYLRTHTQQ